MADALLTVLMPVYNAGRFLKEAIDSILGQTLKEFEFLIIDDGSTDGSIDITNSYNDPRIRLVQNEKNLGISATLNKGIELSNTELIARMDADDISYPTRLEKQYRYFQENPDCVLLSTWAREITEEGETIIVEEFSSTYFNYILNFDCWIYHPTVMYKRSAVMEVGMYGMLYCEDFDLWWKLSRKYKMANLPEVLVDYRSTKESLSRVAKKQEYDKAHRDIILRNARYYTGPDFNLSYEEIECLRSHYDPILSKGSIGPLVQCVKKLDFINACVLKKEDSVLNEEAIRFKRQAVIDNLAKNLSNFKRMLLYLGIGDYQNAFHKASNSISNMFKAKKSKGQL